MKISYQFDFGNALEAFVQDTEERLQVAANALAAEYMAQVRQEVVDLASRELSTRTFPQYLDGLGEVEAEGGQATLTLDKGLPTWIENGRPPFEMPGISDSTYVPFFFWPRSQWRRRKKHGGTIINPRALKRLMRIRRTKGETATGGRAGFSVERYGRRLPAGIASKRRKHHKTDIPAGMYKLKKPSDIKTPGPLGMTFRTHSKDWRHPGIKKHGFFGIAVRHVNGKWGSIQKRMLKGLMG